jgi:hypothetical protein
LYDEEKERIMQNDSIDNLRLDLNRERVRGVIYVRENDTKSRTLHLTLSKDGRVVDLSDAIFCSILILKPDLNECDNPMVRYGNELQYTWRTQDVNVPGECKCQVQVTFKDGAIVTSPEFSLMVYDTEINPKHEESLNEYDSITQILVDVTNLKNDCEGIKQDCQDIEESLPTVYDSTLTIQVNGSDLQTFTANDDTDKTANIIVQTKTSDITNDSDYVSDASYVHTDSNFTVSEKTKLSGIESGAEVNVQSDWTQADSSADDYIKNKPNIPDVSDYYDKTEMDTFLALKEDRVAGKGLSSNDFTDALKSKLDGIASGAEVNVQSDWSQSDNTADDYIKNKPDMSTYYNKTETDSLLGGKVDKVTGKGLSANDFTDTLKTKLDGIASGAEVNVQSDWNQADNTADDYIKNKPSVIQSDWDQADNTQIDYIKNKPDISGVAALTARVQALETKVTFLESVAGYPFDWPEPEE